MKRTTEETANILTDLYEETFVGESYEPFRITWPQLRSIAGIPKLTDAFIKEIKESFVGTNYCLLDLSEYLVLAKETDLSHFRMVPDRLVEERLIDAEDEIEDDFDD